MYERAKQVTCCTAREESPKIAKVEEDVMLCGADHDPLLSLKKEEVEDQVVLKIMMMMQDDAGEKRRRMKERERWESRGERDESSKESGTGG